MELGDFNVGGAGLDLSLEYSHSSVDFSNCFLLFDHFIIGSIVLRVDFSKDLVVLLVLHGFTLLSGLFKLSF